MHDERLAAQLGVALAVTFGLCLVTGLISHLHQNPPDWLAIPNVPAGAYRVTQGLHVASGLASIPILLAKLYVVSPQLPRWPPVDDVVDLMARVALLPLVGGSIFLLATGTANIAGWYPWAFFFPTGHWWAAWLVLGALMVHVALQAPVLRRLWWPSQQPDQDRVRWADPEGRADGAAPADDSGMTRRGLLTVVLGAAGIITLLTFGQTFPPLRRATALAPRRPDIGPQGFPVNRSAAAARTEGLAEDPNYRLVVADSTGVEVGFSLSDLQAMDQVTRELPIACVEGWSASAVWSGVSVRSVLDAAGVGDGVGVTVRSAQASGLYRSSEIDAALAEREDCLLALRVNDEPLADDHGAPLRLIAPNRPGVMQTKWVVRLEVR